MKKLSILLILVVAAIPMLAVQAHAQIRAPLQVSAVGGDSLLGCQIRDVNGDSVANVGDIVFLINFLYRGGPAPRPYQAGDWNRDGVVDIGDVVCGLTCLYRGGCGHPAEM